MPSREILAQPVANVRIIEVENSIRENMGEDSGGTVFPLDFHLEDPAVGAILAGFSSTTPDRCV